MNTSKTYLEVPAQPVDQGIKLPVLVSLDSAFKGITCASLVITFDPKVIKLIDTAPANSDITLSVNEKTFDTGLVPIEISSSSGNPGKFDFVKLVFEIVGDFGSSTQLIADTPYVVYSDATSSAGKGAKAVISVIPKPLEVPDKDLPKALTSQYYMNSIWSNGGTPPLKWSSPDMPEGLYISSDGNISGWPDFVGKASFNVCVTDSSKIALKCSAVLSISSEAGPLISLGAMNETMTYGDEYCIPIKVHGGLPPLNWKLKSGSLPSGIDLTKDGKLKGKCLSTGLYRAYIVTTDSSGNSIEQQVDIKCNMLTHGISVGVLKKVQTMTAVPNLVKHSYNFAIDISLKSGFIKNLKAEIYLNRRKVWRGFFTNGMQKISLSGIQSGIQLLEIKLLNNIKAIGTVGKIKKIIIKEANSKGTLVINPLLNEIVGKYNTFAKVVIMPGTSDGLLITGQNTIDIFEISENGILTRTNTCKSSGIDILVHKIPGLSHNNTFYGYVESRRSFILLYEGRGKKWYTRAVPIGQDAFSISAVDIDNDGYVEALLGTSSGLAKINIEPGVSIETIPYLKTTFNEEVSSIAYTSMDNWGNRKIISSNKYSGSTSIINTPLSQNSLPSSLEMSGQPVALAKGNLGGKMSSDIAVACRTSNKVHIYNEDGNGVFNERYTVDTGAAPLNMILADLNGEGMQSVITADSASNTISVIMPDNKNYLKAELYQGPDCPNKLAAIRDNKGHVHIIASGSCKNELMVWSTCAEQPSCQVSLLPISSQPIPRGSAWRGQPTVFIGNSGAKNLIVKNIRLTSIFMNKFFIMNMPELPLILKPGKIISLDLIMLGDDNAVKGCNVEIVTNDPVYPCICFPIKIISSQTEKLAQIMPGIVKFSAHKESRRISFISCTGKKAALISLKITGKHSAAFKLTNLPAMPLNFNSYFDINAEIDISKFGYECMLYEAYLIAEVKIEGKDLLLASRLEYNPVWPEIDVVPPILNFGAVEYGNEKILSAEVENVFSGDLYVSRVEISGDGADKFSISSISKSLPAFIPSESSFKIGVNYKSCSMGENAEAVLNVYSNSPYNRCAQVKLSSISISADIIITPEKLSLNGVFMYDILAEGIIQLYNFGAGKGHVSISKIEGPFSVNGEVFPLEFYGLTEVKVTADKPEEACIQSGYIEFSTNDPINPLIKVLLTASWN